MYWMSNWESFLKRSDILHCCFLQGLTLERGKANSSMEDSNCLFWKPEELDFNVYDTLQKMSFNNSNNLLERLKSIKHGLASMSSQEDFFRNLR